MKKISSGRKARSRSKAGKRNTTRKTAAKKSPAKRGVKPTSKLLKIPRTGSLAVRMAAAKKIEAMDRPTTARGPAAAQVSHPQRNSNFPDTYITQISVRLEDPDHSVTLTWTGPNGSAQETGPFRSSPGAGLRGLNCDNEATSRRSGSTCTPKGTFSVTGFASRLNSHPEAKDVTWFVPARGIALHYYPSVPKYAASHGCVRLELRRVAQLVKNNSRAGLTSVAVEGTWTKPPHQY